MFFLAFVVLMGCSQTQEDVIKVGMVTDVAGIDDKSFSEITWKGVNEFAEAYNQESGETVEVQYVTPDDTSLPTLVNAVDNLVMSGNEIIVLTGFVFEETTGKVAELYPDIKFILIDGQPLVDGEYVSFDNVVSIMFNEHEAGFLTGIASALQTKTGKLAFLGGVEVPAVQHYGYGFVSGVAYANKVLGTQAQVIDYLYQGTFTDYAAGQAIAGGMFDKGIDIIQHAGGGVGTGAITEAKQREDVYIVGVDTNQYNEGINDESSVILTSAMKHINVAVVKHLEKYVKNDFAGGEVITMTLAEDAVGIPSENPNLTEETLVKINEVIESVKNGKIKVPSTVQELEQFLEDYEYHVEGIKY